MKILGGINKMRNYKERPYCRTILMHLCKEYNCNLKGLWYLNGENFSLSTGLRKQLKKMLFESGVTNKELLEKYGSVR